MADGGIESGFQFDSYKIDKIDFSVEQNINTLHSKIDEYEPEYSFGFRDAFRYKNIADKVIYVTGLEIRVTIKSRADQHDMATGRFITTGLFYGVGKLSEKQEEMLAKVQGPAILFPYARSIVSQTLYNAGFAVPVMPLINVNELAKKMNVKIIDR